MASKYLKNAARSVVAPPQSEPLNERQVPNSAGGFGYAVDNWKRLDRFLILGTEKGSYYASEKKLTKDNVKGIESCLKEDGLKTVNRIVEISDSGRAPKNDPALLALACAAGTGDNKTRSAALDALPKVARIGTHLFHFVDYVTEFRGWGRGLRTAVKDWYVRQTPERLADQVTKYQQRDGWGHRDLLRLTHPKLDGEMLAIARWVVKGEAADVPDRIRGHVELQKTTDVKEAARLIRKYGLVRESVPTELLKDKEVWGALLERMPVEAMVRNLGNMSKCELLMPMSDAAKKICDVLGNGDVLKKARLHPIKILIAAKTYEGGKGIRGSGTWVPVPQVIDALDEAYYMTFSQVQPTGKRFYLGLDISGSMWGGCVAGVEGLTPAVGTGAMAMVTVRSEQNYYISGFTCGNRSGWSGVGGRWGGGNTGMEPLSLSPKQRLDDVVKIMQEMSSRMGGTDCALPMLDAIEKKLLVDTFIIYTDSETWAGAVHVDTAIRRYRDKMGIPAKVVVVGMVANEFTIADPNDAGMLDVVGFDTAVPQIIADFAKE